VLLHRSDRRAICRLALEFAFSDAILLLRGLAFPLFLKTDWA